MGIFVGVNYGGAKGWKYCWSQRIGRARGWRVIHADFFHTGWSGGTAGGRRIVKQAFIFQGALNYCMMIKAGHNGGILAGI